MPPDAIAALRAAANNLPNTDEGIAWVAQSHDLMRG
jgi:hypothetical protein